MEELKPCPFCGGEAEIKDYPECLPAFSRCIYYAEIYCDSPQCGGRLWDYTKEKAVKAWNNRA